jgi:lipoprotein-releasing system ATP-binding protein
MSEPVLVARGVARTYSGGPREIPVLRDLDLEVGERETLAVVGDSGVGKSTLLHVLGGLDVPDAGHVVFRGRDVYATGPRSLALYRNRDVGFVFQFHHLLPEFSARENVEMPFRVGRRAGEAGDRARRLLERLGLGERLDHHPGQLSGGEQQRVAIARALVSGPSIVLADEPTGNLDPRTGREVFAVLRELQEELPFTLVLATHSGRLARECDRVLRLESGRLRPLGERETREYFDDLGV